jgi:uncharacterized heparinase superfamily protein
LAYRLFLRGPLADRIKFHPYDVLPRRLEDAEALLRGRFRFCGETVEVKAGSIFDKRAPSQEWLEALHGFQWLPPLASAGGDAARILATNLVSQWLKRYGKYAEPAWAPQVLARRLLNIFSHGRLVLTNSEVLWRSKIFVSLREQSQMLARIAPEAPAGFPRLESATAIILSDACLDQNQRRLTLGLKMLEEECARQILPDGGHVSRKPEALLHSYRCLTMVIDALASMGGELPKDLRSAHDRMAPMLRFFRHGDGALALFNGGHEGDARSIEALLARDEVRGQPFGHARHSGFHRMALARTMVVMDCGAPPPLAYATDAHAGCLSFEFSTGGQRVIVNCGAGGEGQTKWDDVLSATAAHSTITVADTSMAQVLPTGWLRRLVGPRLLGGPNGVSTNRTENVRGSRIEASHDGYLDEFGICHERQLTLSPQGLSLTGFDRLVPSGPRRHRNQSIPFAARFHIHPDVRMSPSQGGDILLKLPNGEGWRFRAGGGQVSTEESVYLGTEAVRRTEQLVITGAVKDSPAEIAWTFEQIGTDAAAGSA